MFVLHKAQYLKKIICLMAVMSIAWLGIINANSSMDVYYSGLSDAEYTSALVTGQFFGSNGVFALSKAHEQLVPSDFLASPVKGFYEAETARDSAAATTTETGKYLQVFENLRTDFGAIVAPSLLSPILGAFRAQTSYHPDSQAGPHRRIRNAVMVSISLGVAGILGILCLTIAFLGVVAIPLFRAIQRTQRHLDARRDIILKRHTKSGGSGAKVSGASSKINVAAVPQIKA